VADTSASANAGQIAYWNGSTGDRSVALQDRLDAVFAGITATLIGRAALLPGEHVLDVGCGCGETVLRLAAKVGPAGAVLGVDVSKPMLDLAARRVAAAGMGTAALEAAGMANVELVLADASAHRFEDGRFDLVFSRLGVMFFDDPVGAFANIRTSVKPGGRLAFFCWRAMTDNPWFRVPYAAAQPHLQPQPQPPADPDAPGTFAFADPDRVRTILSNAGFSSIDIQRHDPPMRLGGPNQARLAAEFATEVGPVSRALAASEPAARVAARAAIVAELTKFDGPDGIVLPGSGWLVSART